MKNLYLEHPDKCIVCGKPSYGDPQCNDCTIQSQTFANILNKKLKYQTNYNKINDLFFKTLTKAINNQFNLEKKIKLCNQLIGIGMFSIVKFKDKPDKLDEAYHLIDLFINTPQKN